MSYINYEYFTSLYGTELSMTEYDRFAWDAFRKLDHYTTGVDGIRKLRIAFPVDELDAEAVKRCAAKLISIAAQVYAAEKSAETARGYTETANGLQGKVISSVSAGNESITYSSGGATIIDKALADKSILEKLYNDTIREYLPGVKDANGVNLLYMGSYPRVCAR